MLSFELRPLKCDLDLCRTLLKYVFCTFHERIIDPSFNIIFQGVQKNCRLTDGRTDGGISFSLCCVNRSN